MQDIDLSKNGSSDGILPIVIKLCAAALLAPLSIIFNKSLEESVLPSLCKIAKVTPIHKSGVRGMFLIIDQLVYLIKTYPTVLLMA